MTPPSETDWTQPATKGDLALVRTDLAGEIALVRKDMELLELRWRRRMDVQTVLVTLALLGSPLLSALAQRYLPPLP